MEKSYAYATENLRATLNEALQVTVSERTLVIYDTQAPLSRILTECYREALPQARFVDFDKQTPEEVLGFIDELKPKDLVVLIQSTNFRLNEFRFRIELFKRDLKNIEHLHLARMEESQFDTYLASLAYDPAYYRTLGPKLKTDLDQAREVVVECQGTQLVYPGGMEAAKLNIGDYTGMKNAGGTFPIGEVFTEAKDLRTVNGQVLIFAFAGDDHQVRRFAPFRADIREGILTATDAPPEFQHILDRIKEDEEVLVRELGFGINPALDKHHLVNDITAFERQMGVHLSLGAKHGLYPKPGLKRKEGRYHVDVFVDVERVRIDGRTVFEQGKFF
jgi:aminopeptidase